MHSLRHWMRFAEKSHDEVRTCSSAPRACLRDCRRRTEPCPNGDQSSSARADDGGGGVRHRLPLRRLGSRGLSILPKITSGPAPPAASKPRNSFSTSTCRWRSNSARSKSRSIRFSAATCKRGSRENGRPRRCARPSHAHRRRAVKRHAAGPLPLHAGLGPASHRLETRGLAERHRLEGRELSVAAAALSQPPIPAGACARRSGCSPACSHARGRAPSNPPRHDIQRVYQGMLGRGGPRRS